MLRSRRIRLILILSVGLLLWGLPFVIPSAQAQTPRLQGQSASAAAMGNAFVAQADDPSALHYNPAGMTQLHGFQTLFGTSLIGGVTQFTSPTGAQATGDRNGSLAWPPPGHVYLVANLKDLGFSALGDFSAGIGFNNPFGSLSRYPNNGPFNSALTFTTLPLLDIKPTLAYKLNDQLSFGLGADIYTFSGLFGEGHLEQKSIWPGGLGIPGGSLVEINGSDTTAGFNVSFLYTPYRNSDGKPLVNVGMVYRSQATLHLDGQLLAGGTRIADARSTFVVPQVLTGGIALWPVRNKEREWKLELDVDYTGWKSVRNLDSRLSNGITVATPANWVSGYTVMIGTEHKWLNPERLPDWDIALRAGYWHSQKAIPDQTFNPAIPDGDNHAVSTGIGFMCRDNGRFLGIIPCGGSGNTLSPKGLGIDLAYQAILYESRTVAGNVNPTVNGTYRTTLHVGSLNLRVNF